MTSNNRSFQGAPTSYLLDGTVAREIAFRFLLFLQLSVGLFWGLLALTPCLFPPSNVPHSPAQCFTVLRWETRRDREVPARPAASKRLAVAMRGGASEAPS
jgi:hypothetical protein